MDVESGGAITWLILFVLSSGCIIGPVQLGEEPEVVDADDEFIGQYIQEQMKVNEEEAQGGRTTTTVAPVQTTTSTTLKEKEDCPYDCCISNRYEGKDCGRWFTCVNQTCVDRPCPFDCCVLGMYTLKECPGAIECVNYTCVKTDCPREYECCNGTYYRVRKCRDGYSCIGHRCYSKDSDRDGLADVVESNYGSDAKKRDTDGDGLSDHAEVKVYGTDPTSVNTDGDRYKDGVDDAPSAVNTAFINITVYETKVTVNYPVIHKLMLHLDFNQTKPAAGSKIADFESLIRIANTGSDYTDYVNYTYRIGYWCPPGHDVRRNPFVIDQYYENATANYTKIRYTHSRGLFNDTENATTWDLNDVLATHTGRLYPGDRLIKHFKHTFTFEELNESAWEAVASTVRCNYNISIKNVRYESY